MTFMVNYLLLKLVTGEDFVRGKGCLLLKEYLERGRGSLVSTHCTAVAAVRPQRSFVGFPLHFSAHVCLVLPFELLP